MQHIIRIIKLFYNERFEDFSVRLLYFFNTINTYYLLAGILSFLAVSRGAYPLFALVPGMLVGVIIPQIADFHPLFAALNLAFIAILSYVIGLNPTDIGMLLAANCAIFFLIQFTFMGLPDSIVARNPAVAFIKIFNSLYTVAPTTVSFSMSVFYAFFLSFSCCSAVMCSNFIDWAAFAAFSLISMGAALITRYALPRNHFSKFHKPDVMSPPLFQRLLILNIDGVRLDIFNSLDLPAISRMKNEGAWHEKGLETVYRALTNPAFASIFTGTIPRIHGVRDNNFGQSIITEGLPDIVPAIAYGSMHVKHFCKRYWETKIVSLPEHSVYKSDEVVVQWLKEDIANRPDVRLFVVDFSESDFLGHAFGSTSRQYRDALVRIDRKIGEILEWLETNGHSKGLGIIVCSDHGIAAIDHSYLIAPSERHVPFVLWGEGIRKNFRIDRPGKIMDICCTAAFLLGVRYPFDARGQVFTEALENHDRDRETDGLITRFNRLKYEAEESLPEEDHPEIYEGDRLWWEKVFRSVPHTEVRVLDVGCGHGFVAERCLAAGAQINEFVCQDISQKSLEMARKRLEGKGPFKFASSLDEVRGNFNVITVSSVFHHLRDPLTLSQKLERLSAEEVTIIGTHEPDRRAFRNPLFTLMANLYKSAGGGISINEAMVRRFNQMLQGAYPGAPKVCKEEILQIVEYHSPIEQFDDCVDRESGFEPETYLQKLFPGCEIVLLESYSTCFYRPWSRGFPALFRALASLALEKFFTYKNLFRYVVRRGSK